MAGGGGGPAGSISAEPNVIPMIDIMLVLLIIFMISQPLTRMAIDVQVPPPVTNPTTGPSTQLVLEITESVIMQNADFAASILNSLSDLGIHISIDDFGTGYSSLAHLKRFSVNTLKIDKSFVRDVDLSSTDAAIVTAIITMGNSLNLNVIAEGVEIFSSLTIVIRCRVFSFPGRYRLTNSSNCSARTVVSKSSNSSGSFRGRIIRQNIGMIETECFRQVCKREHRHMRSIIGSL